jgi:hypothetical protein
MALDRLPQPVQSCQLNRHREEVMGKVTNIPPRDAALRFECETLGQIVPELKVSAEKIPTIHAAIIAMNDFARAWLERNRNVPPPKRREMREPIQTSVALAKELLVGVRQAHQRATPDSVATFPALSRAFDSDVAALETLIIELQEFVDGNMPKGTA